MPRPTILVSILAALLLFLSACDPAGNGGTAYGQDDLDQAVTGIVSDLEELGAAFEGDLGVAALIAFPGFFPTVSSPIVLNEGTLSLPLVRPSQATSLQSGVWVWDDSTFAWVEVNPSANLVLRWSFLDAVGATRAAAMVVDWGATVDVRDHGGELVEVPTAMNVTMTVDTTIVVADFDAEFDWYTAPACSAGILEPNRVYVGGSFGTDATLAFDDITFAITPAAGTNAQIASGGDIVASAEGDRAGFGWDVTLTGPLTRGPNCFITGFEPESGDVNVLLFSEQAGVSSSLGVALTFDNIVVDDFGEFVAVDLDGNLTIDGAAAVSFSGTLDDEDGNGIPGDNLVLVFANGDTTTLEAFIESQIEATAATAMRVLSLFR